MKACLHISTHSQNEDFTSAFDTKRRKFFLTALGVLFSIIWMISSVQIKYVSGSPVLKTNNRINNERNKMVFKRYSFLQHQELSNDMKSLLDSLKKNEQLKTKQKLVQHEDVVPQPVDSVTEKLSPAYLQLKARQLQFSQDSENLKDSNPVNAQRKIYESATSDQKVKFANPKREKGCHLSCSKLKSDKHKKYDKELRSIYKKLNRLAAELDALLQKKPKVRKTTSF